MWRAVTLSPRSRIDCGDGHDTAYVDSADLAKKAIRKIAELGWKRHEYVVSSKLFWGIDGDLVNIDAATFECCPDNSIDYAVMEKTSSACVVPLTAGWNDVGSWSSISMRRNRGSPAPTSAICSA